MEPKEKVHSMRHPKVRRYHKLTATLLCLQTALEKAEKKERDFYLEAMSEAITCTKQALNDCVLETSLAKITVLKVEVQCLSGFDSKRFLLPSYIIGPLKKLCERFRQSSTLLHARVDLKSKPFLNHAMTSFCIIEGRLTRLDKLL